MFTGQLGGPVADIVKLIGEVVAVERAPITFDYAVEHGCNIMSWPLTMPMLTSSSWL